MLNLKQKIESEPLEDELNAFCYEEIQTLIQQDVYAMIDGERMNEDSREQMSHLSDKPKRGRRRKKRD